MERKSLVEAMVKKKRREIAGARSSNRFDFQKDWALCKLLELHGTAEDYLLLCEHHDDIVVLDSSSYPTKASFFQIKSKQSGYWTLTPLIHRKKDSQGKHLSSILGNLFDHTLTFKDGVDNLNLVSNAYFKLKTEEGDTLSLTEFTTLALSAGEHQKLVDGLTKELGPEIDMTIECRLSVTPLSLLESGIHAKGRLEDFLCRSYEGDRHPTSALYKTLFDEIRRLTNYEGDCSTFEVLSEKRGICREQFESFLQCANAGQSPGDIWLKIEQQLRAEGFPFAQLRVLEQEWRQYEIERFDPTNESLHRSRREIEKMCSEALETHESSTLSDLTQVVTDRATSQGIATKFKYLRAMILWGFNEKTTIQKTDPKSTKEK